MKTAVLYTGQGSQRPGMGRAFYDASAVFRQAFDSAELDFDLHQVCFEDPDHLLTRRNIPSPAWWPLMPVSGLC